MFLLNHLQFLVPKYTSMVLIIANYSIITTLSFLVFSFLQVSNLYNSNSNANKLSTFTLFNLFFFLNLAGIPPFPGFFIKISFLLNILQNINLHLVIILIIINFTIFYFYIQFYKNIEVYSKTKKVNNLRTTISLTVVTIYVLINFYPLYNILILFF